MPIKLDNLYRRFYKSIPHASNYPIITNVSATEDGLVTWTTDVASTSQVMYGFVPYLGFQSNYDSTYVTSHSVQLTDLTFASIYYFKVQSFNQDALSISDLYSFSTSIVGVYPAFILTSTNLTRFAITVTITGNLNTEPTPTGPPNAYEPIDLIFQDLSSIYWVLFIDDTGHLNTVQVGGDHPEAVLSIPLIDANFVEWELTVDTSGNLVTT